MGLLSEITVRFPTLIWICPTALQDRPDGKRGNAGMAGVILFSQSFRVITKRHGVQRLCQKDGPDALQSANF